MRYIPIRVQAIRIVCAAHEPMPASFSLDQKSSAFRALFGALQNYDVIQMAAAFWEIGVADEIFLFAAHFEQIAGFAHRAFCFLRRNFYMARIFSISSLSSASFIPWQKKCAPYTLYFGSSLNFTVGIDSFSSCISKSSFHLSF